MKTIKQTGEAICSKREELVEKYFGGMNVYAEGNMGLVTLLSDLQHEIQALPNKGAAEHYRQILNDIKCILIEDVRATREKKEAEQEFNAHLGDGRIY